MGGARAVPIIAILVLVSGCQPPAADPTGGSGQPTSEEPSADGTDEPAGPRDRRRGQAEPPEIDPGADDPDNSQPAEDPDELPPGTTLVWTRGRLPEALITAVTDHPDVAAVTVVEVASAGLVRSVAADGDVVDQPDDGWRLPLEVLGVDPASYAEVTGLRAVADLGGGGALLSETSAEVRRLSVGGQLHFTDGARSDVVAVVADELVGAAELVVAAEDLPDGAVPRYLLARPTPEAQDLGAALDEVVGTDPPVRIRRRSEAPVLRHADAVTAPSRLKARFGEFALRDASGRDVEQDPGWIDEHVRTAELPLLGRITCHREALEVLQGAMEALIDRGHDDLVAPGDHAGCWVPRFQDQGGPLSAHAWGVAVDLDPTGLPQGSDAEPSAPLLAVMGEHGFTNGSGWLLPDPMHFELVPDRDPN